MSDKPQRRASVDMLAVVPALPAPASPTLEDVLHEVKAVRRLLEQHMLEDRSAHERAAVRDGAMMDILRDLVARAHDHP